MFDGIYEKRRKEEPTEERKVGGQEKKKVVQEGSAMTMTGKDHKENERVRTNSNNFPKRRG